MGKSTISTGHDWAIFHSYGHVYQRVYTTEATRKFVDQVADQNVSETRASRQIPRGDTETNGCRVWTGSKLGARFKKNSFAGLPKTSKRHRPIETFDGEDPAVHETHLLTIRLTIHGASVQAPAVIKNPPNFADQLCW